MTATAASTKTERRGAVLDVLRELLAERRETEIVDLVRQLVARNGELERRLARMDSRRHKNEGVSSAQLALLLDALEARADGADGPSDRTEADQRLRAASGADERGADEERTTRPKQQPPLRRPLPAGLRRVDNPITVPAAERRCPTCGVERVCMGHETTEVLDLIPAEVIVRIDRREKLTCETCDAPPVRAPGGDKVVTGGRLGTTLVAELLVDKYADGLPLHRQKQRFARLGVDLPISTLADQVTWATDLLRPLWRAAIAEVLSAKVMHLDGTGLPVLDKSAPGGKRLGALWGYVGDTDVAAYVFASTGKKNKQRPDEIGPEEMLGLRSGFTVADASTLFDLSFRRDGIIECGCNMHARRYFSKALDARDKRAALPLAAYKKLYEIEAETRDLAAEAKLAARQARSKPVFDELLSWGDTHRPHEPPSSAMGKALQYLDNQRVALGRFLEAAEVPIDNGIVERLHVRAALTRKNFLFAGSDAGGDRAAIAYTILSCCRLAEVDPIEYLGAMLPRMRQRVRIVDTPGLLPAQWKRARVVSEP